MKSQTDEERNNVIGRTTMYDSIVIGAGPAGLQAALTLGRMHRSTLLLDSGEYRNGTVLHMHNMIGASQAGTIAEVYVAAGQSVDHGTPLLKFKEE